MFEFVSDPASLRFVFTLNHQALCFIGLGIFDHRPVHVGTGKKKKNVVFIVIETKYEQNLNGD